MKKAAIVFCGGTSVSAEIDCMALAGIVACYLKSFFGVFRNYERCALFARVSFLITLFTSNFRPAS